MHARRLNIVTQKVIIKENVDFSISFELDIMVLSAGTYFYNIDYKSTSIAKGKFVKQ
jgi:hypothetical protein